MKTELLNTVREYLDNANVIVTNEYYWYLGVVEVIANSIGCELDRDELKAIAEDLVGTY